MKVIAVTGTPGTGKTTFSKKLAKKLNFYYIDVNQIISKYKLSEGYDRKRQTKIIDIKKLNKVLIQYIEFFKKFKFVNERAPIAQRNENKNISEIKTATNKQLNQYTILNKKLKINKNQIKKLKGIIIDSHLSHYLPRKYVDFCIVTKCGIKEINKRLQRKGFSKSKIQENLQAEIFDICLNEAKEQKHKVLVIDTTKGFNMGKLAKQLGG